nr:hypothetical protein [uncultured Dyadobacter sp.]
MRTLKAVIGVCLFVALAIKLAGCKVVEKKGHWESFNDELGKPAQISRNLLYYDVPDSNFFRMNIYWRQIEITPNTRSNREMQDFTYKWFTSYDNDPNRATDSLIQNVELYLYRDGRALMRSIIFPEEHTKKPGKVNWKRSYGIRMDLLNSSKKYVKKNKIKFGRFRLVGDEDEVNKKAEIKIDLYAPVRTRRLFKKKHVQGDRRTLKAREDRISLSVDLFQSLTHEKADPADSAKTNVDPYVNLEQYNREQRKKSRRRNNPLQEPVAINNFMNRAQIMFIDLKSDIGSNGGSVLKVTPTQVFGLGELKNGTPAQMYFRLFRLP